MAKSSNQEKKIKAVTVSKDSSHINTPKTIANLDQNVNYTSATGTTWNQDIVKTIQKLQDAGKDVYTSVDVNGNIHYSTSSQSAANKTAAKYNEGSTAYTRSNGVEYLYNRGSEDSTSSPAGNFTSVGSGSTNYDLGSTTLPGVNNTYNTYANQQQTGVALDTTNPFGFITNQKTIKDLLDDATNAAYVTKEKEAKRGLVDAENTAYANTNNAINDLRRSLAGSAVNGANRGSAAATALQSLLGLGQQNNELVTTGLQNIIDVADQKAAALAKNASDSVDISNNAKNLQSNSATSVYSSDATMWSELTSALSSLASSLNTDSVNKTMNDDTNATNKEITKLQTAADKAIANINANATIEAAKKGQTQNINYSGGYTTR